MRTSQLGVKGASSGVVPPPSPARALVILDVLSRSARINRMFISGDGYGSNTVRLAYLRGRPDQNLLAAERAGSKPRIVFKFGGSHMMKGITATNTLDLGTAASVMAESRGERAFSVLILGGSGGKASPEQ